MATARKPVIKSLTVPRFGEVAQRLVDNGYPVVPLVFGEKRPSISADWTHYSFEPKDVRGAFSHKNDGTGIPCGEISGTDIDIMNVEVAAEIEALAETMLGKAPRRIGLAPKVLRLYRTDKPFAKITSNEVVLPGDAKDAKKHRVEILGVGQQFVAYNMHPATKRPYIWNGAGDPLSVPASELVTVTEAQMREFIGKVNAILAKHASTAANAAVEKRSDLDEQMRRDAEAQAAALEGKGTKFKADDPDECRTALQSIPNDDLAYDPYIKIGYAVAGALGADGHDDWHDWAAKSAKYDEKKTEDDWQGFMRNPVKSGAGTIFREAMNAGWKSAKPANSDDDDVLIESLTDEWLNELPPQQEWLWEKRVPMGSLTAVIAEGGTGKSYLLLRMAMATASGSQNFLTPHNDPRTLRKGTSVFVNAEDPPSEVRRRFWSIQQRKIAEMAKSHKGAELAKRIADYQGALKARFKMVHLVGRKFSLIDMVDGQLKWGPGLHKLTKELQAIKDLVFVALDPLARLHAADENSNAVSTMLVTAGERIAQQFHCAATIAHHVSKDAVSRSNITAHSGRGGSAFGDGARSVLRLIAATVNDLKGLKLLRFDGAVVDPQEVAAENIIILHHAKNSYGPRQRPLFMLRDKDTGELLPLKVTTDERDMYTVNLLALTNWMTSNPAPITKDTFRDATQLRQSVFEKLSKKDWLEFFDTAVVKGDLIEDASYHGKNSSAKGYRLTDTRHIPASGTAGIPIIGTDGKAGGIPAADPDVLGGGYPRGGYPEAPKDAPTGPLKGSKAAPKRQGSGGYREGGK